MRARKRHLGSDATTIVGGRPAALPLAAGAAEDPVLRVILDRIETGSRPRERDDPHVVSLAIEGGGMRGAVSAGMCVVLEAAGAIPAFDRIYGVSAGALNGWATAAGQAALGATHYHDAVERRVINRVRALRGGPVVDFGLLFDELIEARKPISFERLAAGPDLRVLATSLETMSLCVLRDFADAREALQAVRASASLPRLGGDPPLFRGERMADGGLVEPIPVGPAVAEGSTHVLVLRSRPAGYRRPALAEMGDLLALRDDPALLELVRDRQGLYNRQAAALERGSAGLGRADVLQVAVPEGARLIGRLEADAGRITEVLRLGAAAMAETLLAHPIDLCWQPVVYPRGASPSMSRASSDGASIIGK